MPPTPLCHATRNHAQFNWLLYQLTDSLLPTGGFVCSAGLEAAVQQGWIHHSDQLLVWCQHSIDAYAATSLPFLDAAYQFACTEEPVVLPTCLPGWCTEKEWDPVADTSSNATDRWSQLQILDDRCDACFINPVARRSSHAQGRAFMTAYIRCFDTQSDTHAAPLLARRFHQALRLGQVHGHLSIAFGLVCAALEVDLDRARELFMFLYARNLMSAAVRLNLIGPYLAQRLLQQLSQTASEAVERYLREADGKWGLELTAVVAQTAPLLDLFQGTHDRLYSRLFNS